MLTLDIQEVATCKHGCTEANGMALSKIRAAEQCTCEHLAVSSEQRGVSSGLPSATHATRPRCALPYYHSMLMCCFFLGPF